MDYPQTLKRLYALSKRGVTLGLERVRRAASLLGDPQKDLLSVQIGGTNGKGTASAVLAHALSYAGLKAGLFTSPHLHRFSERIRIDGREAPPEVLAAQLERVLDLNDAYPDIALSFFEVATLTALLIFKEARVEVAVLEVGLGGRLDATSVAEPALTAITSIGLDHTALLGDTEEQIAVEKAGIARPGVPLALGSLSKEALGAVEKVAADRGAKLLVIHRDFQIPQGLRLPWPGPHQVENVAIAAELYRLLQERHRTLRPEAFAEAVPTVFWPGRFERIAWRGLTWILDCAHNLQAAEALAKTVRDFGVKPDVLLFGALRDKPAAKMLDLYRSLVERIVLMPPPIDRAQDPAAIAKEGDLTAADADEALAFALREASDLKDKNASRQAAVLVTGSIFTVAAIRERLLGEKADPPVGL